MKQSLALASLLLFTSASANANGDTQQHIGRLSALEENKPAPKPFTAVDKHRESVRGMYNILETPSASSSDSDEITWTNPVADKNLIQPPQASADQVNVPEGLSLSGKLLTSRDNVVYVHGWSADGSAENFLYPAEWQAKGFNTFIFRWHRDAFEPGSPGRPEAKIWTTACEKGAQSLAKLADALPGGNKSELRLVGHSLGAQMVTCMAARLKQIRSFNAPLRIELLDPWITPGVRFPANLKIQGVYAGENIAQKVENILKYLRRNDAALVDYSSITGGFTTSQFHRSMHFQALSMTWLGGNPLYRHTEMRGYYFGSIKQPIPKIHWSQELAFSALTPSQEIREREPVRLIQVWGEQSVGIGDDVYAKRW